MLSHCLQLLLIRTQLYNKREWDGKNAEQNIHNIHISWLHVTRKMFYFDEIKQKHIYQTFKTLNWAWQAGMWISALGTGSYSYLNDLKSSTNSMKLIVLSEIMRFWKPLKQPLPRPCHDLLLHALQATDKRKNILTWTKKEGFKIHDVHTSSLRTQRSTYPGCDLAVPERIGEDCGRDWPDPAMLEEEEDEDEEASNPGLLLDERENGPGKLSSVEGKRTEGK